MAMWPYPSVCSIGFPLTPHYHCFQIPFPLPSVKVWGGDGSLFCLGCKELCTSITLQYIKMQCSRMRGISAERWDIYDLLPEDICPNMFGWKDWMCWFIRVFHSSLVEFPFAGAESESLVSLPSSPFGEPITQEWSSRSPTWSKKWHSRLDSSEASSNWKFANGRGACLDMSIWGYI